MASVSLRRSSGDVEAGLEPLQEVFRHAVCHTDLQAVLFCEFHTALGPNIVFQSPHKFLSKDKFTSIDKYIITKPELSGRLICFTEHGYRFLGQPVDIADSRYDRNHLLFNVVLVLSMNADIPPFERIAAKLARYMRQLEVETGMLSDQEVRQSLEPIFESVFHGLSTKGQCAVEINPATVIRLRLLQEPPPVRQIKPYMVPVVTRQQLLRKCGTIDQVVRRLIPFLDGISYMKRIAHLSQVDVDLVENALQCLVQCGAVVLVETLQFCNHYVVTPGIVKLEQDVQLQQECLAFITKSKATPLHPKQLLEIYCDLVPEEPLLTVRSLIERHSTEIAHVDIRRFIQFGRIHNLIRQVKRYPFRQPEAAIAPGTHKRLGPLIPWLNGHHSTDELCCYHELSSKELDEVLDSDPYTFMFRK